MSTSRLGAVGISFSSPVSPVVSQPNSAVSYKPKYDAVLNEGCNYFNASIGQNIHKGISSDIQNGKINKKVVEILNSQLNPSVIEVMSEVSKFVQNECQERINAKGPKIPVNKPSEFWSSNISKVITLRPGNGDNHGKKDFAMLFDRTIAFLDEYKLDNSKESVSSSMLSYMHFSEIMPNSFGTLFYETNRKVLNALFDTAETEKTILFTSAKERANFGTVKMEKRTFENLSAEQEFLVNRISLRVLARALAALNSEIVKEMEQNR